MPSIEVLANKTCTTKFTITAGSRKEADDAIAAKLLSDKELVWTDANEERVNVACISDNTVWKPRRRFFLTNDSETE
jgi:hypothetical protein